MSSYPLGGSERQENVTGGVALFDVVHTPATYVPSAADALDKEGTILGRITASEKLTPSDVGAADGSEVPVGVLGSDVQADGTPSDVELRYIVSGQVDASKLIRVGAGGVTEAVKDQLRTFGIIPQLTKQLANFDNPQP